MEDFKARAEKESQNSKKRGEEREAELAEVTSRYDVSFHLNGLLILLHLLAGLIIMGLWGKSAPIPTSPSSSTRMRSSRSEDGFIFVNREHSCNSTIAVTEPDLGPLGVSIDMSKELLFLDPNNPHHHSRCRNRKSYG